MHRIAIVNQKGGCGKTTTAINLAGVLARRGLRTLLVDMDPQGHCAAGLAIPEQRIDLIIGDAMSAADPVQVDPSRLLWRVSRNLDLAPATMRLAGLEAPRSEFAARPEPERALSRVLARFDALYDVCLIDCSPAIGLLTFNALSAATDVLIPVETGFFSLQGASKQINTIKSLARRLSMVGGAGPSHYILPTMHDERSALSSDLLEELKKRFAGRVVPVVIRFDQSLKEAASFGQPVVEYSPDSAGAADYGLLADWLLADCIRQTSPLPSTDPINRWPVAPSQPAESGMPAIEAASSAVHVVSGIASRLPVPAGPWPAPSSSPAVDERPASFIPPIGATRAADMVARARKLQQRAALPPHADTTVPAPEAEIAAPAAPRSSPVHGPDQSSSLYGARATPAGVLFVQPASMGRVAVAGDFNHWSADANPLVLNRDTGALEAIVPLPPGVVQYRLVIDGQWMPDPHNPLRVPNPFGGSNSLIAVPDFSRVLTGAGA